MHDIATLRRLRGLSQRALAAKAGLSPSRVAEAEAGTRPLTVEASLKAAPVLGVDPIGLYLSQTIPALKASIESGEEPPIKAATIARSLIETIESGGLSPQQRRAARIAIEDLAAMVEEAAQKQQPGTLTSLVRRTSSQTHPLDPPMRDLEDGARASLATANNGGPD